MSANIHNSSANPDLGSLGYIWILDRKKASWVKRRTNRNSYALSNLWYLYPRCAEYWGEVHNNYSIDITALRSHWTLTFKLILTLIQTGIHAHIKRIEQLFMFSIWLGKGFWVIGQRPQLHHHTLASHWVDLILMKGKVRE